MKPEWRLFEELVARLERAAAPRHATVKSPDRIRDQQTGKLREVDASIKFRTGFEDILITIECRKRKRKADDTWIEQLATKRQKLGAAKTIAVSSSGFSKSAEATASMNAIELRTFGEVQQSSLDDWFLPPHSAHVFRQIENIECQVQTIDGQIRQVDPMNPCLQHSHVRGLFPPVLLIKFAEINDEKRFWQIPFDGTRSKLRFCFGASGEHIPLPTGIEPVDSNLQMEIDGQLSIVDSVEVICTAWYETIVADRESMTHHESQSSQGLMSRHSSFIGKSVDLPVEFEHFQSDDGSHTSTATFPSGVTIESIQIPLTRRLTDVWNIDVRSLHLIVVTIKMRSQEPRKGFLFTFPRGELATNESLRGLLRDHFLFAQHTDTDRMRRFLTALERRTYLHAEVGKVLQLPKRDVEYIELMPDRGDA